MYLRKAGFEVIRMGLTHWHDVTGLNVLKEIEAEGRKCYKTEGKITSDSAFDFVKLRMAQGHVALLDSMHVTVDFITSRGISHEWIRHKLTEIVGTGCIEPTDDWTPMAVVQESTRYCNYKKHGQVMFIIPPWIDLEEGVYERNMIGSVEYQILTDVQKIWLDNRFASEKAYNSLIENGLTAQQAREELLIGVKTEFRVTCSLTEWRHVFLQRTSSAAHPQMTEIMRPLCLEFKKRIPIIFDDINWRE